MAKVSNPFEADRARRNETPTPETIEVGQRFRFGRQQAGLSQRSVADRSGISQSEISRLERGKTPGMSAYRVFAIALSLGDGFPFGTCPHPHRCAYRLQTQLDPIDRVPMRLADSEPDPTDRAPMQLADSRRTSAMGHLMEAADSELDS